MLKFFATIAFAFTLAACSDYSPNISGTTASNSNPTPTASVSDTIELAQANTGGASSSAGGQKYVAGKHYRVLDRPVPTANPDKIEIAEFFWYGCGHCYNFEPRIQRYKKSMPDNYEFVGVPAIWRDAMAVHAKAYYATKALKRPDLHQAVFEAMNQDRNPLSSANAVAKLFAKHGIEEARTLKLMNSFGINAQVNKAKSVAAGAKLTGTPALMVNGKYMIEARLAGSQAEMIKVADYLAKMESAN